MKRLEAKLDAQRNAPHSLARCFSRCFSMRALLCLTIPSLTAGLPVVALAQAYGAAQAYGTAQPYSSAQPYGSPLQAYTPPRITPISPSSAEPNPYLVFSRHPARSAPVPTPVVVLPANPLAILQPPAWPTPNVPRAAAEKNTVTSPAMTLPVVKLPAVTLPAVKSPTAAPVAFGTPFPKPAPASLAAPKTQSAAPVTPSAAPPAAMPVALPSLLPFLPPLPAWPLPQLIPPAQVEQAKPAPVRVSEKPAPAPQPKAPLFELPGLPSLPAMPEWQLPSFLPPAEVQPAPAAKEETPETKSSERSLADLGESLRSFFTDEEVDMLVEYMKESVMASFKGEEVYLPPDLAFKLEVLLVRLQKEGGLYMDNLIKKMERDLANSLKPKPKAKPAPATTQAWNSGAPAAKVPSKADNSISAAIDEWLKSLKPKP
jgi:hypothetical protein